jgi:hypothetical protein
MTKGYTTDPIPDKPAGRRYSGREAWDATQDYGVANLRWKDLIIDAHEGGGASALTQEAFRDTNCELLFMVHNIADRLSFEEEMPHDWKPGTEMKLHAHIIPMSNGSGLFALDYEVYCANVGEAFPALASWTTGTATLSLSASDQYKHLVIPLVTLPGTGKRESAMILCTIARNPATDTYQTNKDHGTVAANVAILKIDVHYQAEKSGTVEEYPGA